MLEHYEYDANGNRTAAVRWLAGGADTSTATYDAQDRMTRYRTVKYTYTANGELLRRIAGTDTTKYTYDQLGNLLEVKLPGGPTVTYKVDGRNRRVAKLVDGTFKRGWIYQDGLRVVGELDSTGALAIRYVYGSRSHVPDYMVRYGTTYRLITDQLGSVRQVVDASSGTVAESITYDAWGRIVAQQSPGFVSVAYAGGLYDQHTGLTRFGARDYDASVGRWTCKDPAGFAAGTNPYCYVGSDPTGNIDPIGLSPRAPAGTAQRGVNYNCQQTREILEWVRQEIEVPWLEGIVGGYLHHSEGGYFDFKVNEPRATFIVNGQRLNADEFGNFVAGYSGTKLGAVGAAGVRVGGIAYDLEYSRVAQVPFDWDEDSMPAIRLGIDYARLERANGSGGCRCP